MEAITIHKESLVAERIAQLNDVRRRRDELLTEMYILSRGRDEEGYRILTGELDPGDLRAYLEAHDLRKQPGVEDLDPLLEDLPEPRLPSPLRFSYPSGSRSPSRTLSASAEPHTLRTSTPPNARASKSHTPECEEETMNVDEALLPSPSRAEEQPDGVTKEEEHDVAVLNDPPESLPQLPASTYSTEEIPSTFTPQVVGVDHLSPEVAPTIGQLRGDEVMVLETPKPVISETALMQNQGESSRVPLQIRTPQDVSDEDDVSALLHSATISEPPMPDTRNGYTQPQYLLSDPPTSTLFAPPTFSFDDEMLIEPSVLDEEKHEPVGLPLSDALKNEKSYTLPPLKALPLEFQRKSKPTRRQKRDRDKDKDGKGHAEWTPMGANKWGATIRANPVATKMAKSSKVLSTRDWNVAFTELRIYRALQKVEELKEAGRWSFRQPKKQRGVGGLMKTHRDYLLDEMKWMRTDFREERRWKLALAYTLAHAVMEWHEAGSLEERVYRGICKLWRRPRQEELESDENIDKAQDLFDSSPEDSKGNSTPGNDDGSEDDSDEEDEKDARDFLNASAVLQDALDQAQEATTTDLGSISVGSVQRDVRSKLEDEEDRSALRGTHTSISDDPNRMNVDTQPQGEAKKPQTDTPSPSDDARGLKSSSQNPLLPQPGPSHSNKAPNSKSKPSRSNAYVPLREEIVYSDLDKLIINLEDLDLVKGMSEPSTDDPILNAPLPPPDLYSIFPDLQPYTFLDVAPPPDGRRKSDRRDRDDPNKRAEDTTYSKLVPTNEFMLQKMTLVGTLKPSKHWSYTEHQWHDLDETAVVAEFSSPTSRPVEESAHSTLFEISPGVTGTAMSLGRKRMPADYLAMAEASRGNANKRRLPDHSWAAQDDAVLKQVVERYPGNWVLIAEAFNTARVTIPTEKRTWMECRDRYAARFMTPGGGNEDAQASAQTPTTTIATRGTKRANNALATSAATSNNMDYKRRRHSLMHDTIRKAAKKREQTLKAQAAQRKPPAVHDTHGQYNKMPRYTPQELVRMKQEKEAREQYEALMRKQQQESHIKQQQLLQRAQAGQAGQPSTPNRNPSNGIVAHQGVPLRGVNISQQQRLLGNAANRISPGTNVQAQTQTQAQAQVQAQVQAQAHAQVAQRLAAAQAQAQAQGQVPVQVPSNTSLAASGAPALSSAHLSAAYAARPTSTSPLPHQSPPHTAAVAHATSPRPPSAQAHPGIAEAQQAAMARSQMAQYYAQFTPEQIEQFQAQQRLRLIQQQQAAQAQAQAVAMQQHQQHQSHTPYSQS